MTVSIIAAVAENGAIGKDNDLIWHLPDDMRFFKEKTKGHPVIMGRKNFLSIPHKFRPLPNRPNIIVTRDRSFDAENVRICHSIEDAITLAKTLDNEEVFIIGGGEVYKYCLVKNYVINYT